MWVFLSGLMWLSAREGSFGLAFLLRPSTVFHKFHDYGFLQNHPLGLQKGPVQAGASGRLVVLFMKHGTSVVKKWDS